MNYKRVRLRSPHSKVGNTTYSCSFGRYYKDGDRITRDEYFKAKPDAKIDSTNVGTVVDEDSTVKVREEDIPKYLYHCTFESNLDSIADLGLGASRKMMGGDAVEDGAYGNDLYNGQGTFFTEDPQEAVRYMENDAREDRTDNPLVVLRIASSKLNKDNLYYDTNNSETCDYLNGGKKGSHVTYYYKGVISNPQSKMVILDD